MTLRVSSLVKNRRHALGLFRTHGLNGEVEWRVEPIAMQKQQGAKRSILGRRRHLLIYRQVCQKCRDFWANHLVEMSFVVEENVTLKPSDLRFLRANRVLLEPDGIAHLVKQFRATVLHD
jgi:hypothetical protein